ncbi:MAG: NUDIX domain-containing protein [Bacteroidales bacterium]|nr:NUDIX domain-containing protein [Bacteroidales bacterium]
MQLNKSLKIILFITIGHIALIIYSSYYLSDEAWAFISGGLFYILFIGYFIYEYSKNKLKNLKYRKEEWLPIVNEKGELIGKKPRSLCHHKKNKPLHPVVHLHVFNKSHKLFLQKRPISKDIQPGKWDTSVGGHISFGEDIETTLLRETQEEIGLKEFKANFITQYIWESDAEREFIFMFYTITDNKLNININEVEEGKYWKYKEIEENLEKGVFTPNFEYEYNILKNIIKKLEE